MELILIQELPGSVRQGYIAFKYVLKRFLKAHRGHKEAGDGRKHVGSYHFKTVFLRYLEKRSPSEIISPFQLFLDLLIQLNVCLELGNLPHYFLAECDLLETVDGEGRHIARQAIKDILSDPLNALLTSPTAPQQIYGDVCPDDLVSAFSKVVARPTCQQSQRALSKLLARVDKIRQQRYREQRDGDEDEKEHMRVSGRVELTRLVKMLKHINYN